MSQIAGDESPDQALPDGTVIDPRPNPRTLVGRALTLRCPYCGGSRIFASWLTLKERCPRCRSLFEREDGYFVGGYAINLIVAEFLAFGIVLVLILFADLSVLQLQITGALLALGLPILFFPFSRTVWIALDLFLHPPGGER